MMYNDVHEGVKREREIYRGLEWKVGMGSQLNLKDFVRLALADYDIWNPLTQDPPHPKKHHTDQPISQIYPHP